MIGDRAAGPLAGRPWLRLVVGLGLIVGLVAVAYGTGLTDLVNDRDRFEQRVRDSGPWAPVVFVGLFTLLVPVGVPGLLFVVPATLLWSAPVAIGLSLAGGMTSSVIGMVFARHVGRRSIEHRLSDRFRAWDERIARTGLWGVVVFRTFTYLAAPADWVVGLSSVPMGTAVLGTAIGLTVPTLFVVLVGGEALAVLLDRPWVTAAVAVALVGVGMLAWRRRRATR